MFSREKRTGLRALTCAAALLGLLGAAGPALASDAWLEPYVVKYEADPGEANRTTITSNSNVQLGGGGPFVDDAPAAIDIDDVGANITPHWGFLHHGGCETISPSRVWCSLEDDFVDVDLGDRGDRFSMEHPVAAVRARVSGGPGDDTLLGGRGSDLLYGSDGPDTLDGRGGADVLSGGGLNGAGGADTADYSNRTVPITVTIPEPPPPYTGPIGVDASSAIDLGPGPRPQWPVVAGDDGASGEGDDVQADVENVHGGWGADSLIGSSAGNRLEGYGGDDSLKGWGGDDFLRGGTGHDRLNGGSGDDTFQAQDGQHDRIDCGSGSNVVWADPIDSFRDCDPEEIFFGG